MATLNKTVSGYLHCDGEIIETDIVLQIGENLSLSTYSGLTLTVPLKPQTKTEAIKALGE